MDKTDIWRKDGEREYKDGGRRKYEQGRAKMDKTELGEQDRVKMDRIV